MAEKNIYVIRGQRVMLSTNLAESYGVQVKALIQAVKRNMDRFPEDFMFQLTAEEYENLKSQIVTSRWGGIRRAVPYAFTEHGVAMLSSVLSSKKAIQVNILVIRMFIKLREFALAHKDVYLKIDALEKKYDQQFQVIFKAIMLMLDKPKDKPRF